MTDLSMLPKSLSQLVREKTAGERLVWIGRPDSGRILKRGLWAWMFALPWTVFSLAWTSVPVSVLLFAQGPDKLGGWGRPVMAVMALFGLPFVAAGFYMMAAPLLAAAGARRTAIALTEERLAIISDGRTGTVRSVPISSIVRTDLRLKRDGSGDVALHLGAKRDSEGDKVEVTEDLIGVADANGLDRALRGLIARSAG